MTPYLITSYIKFYLKQFFGDTYTKLVIKCDFLFLNTTYIFFNKHHEIFIYEKVCKKQIKLHFHFIKRKLVFQ